MSERESGARGTEGRMSGVVFAIELTEDEVRSIEAFLTRVRVEISFPIAEDVARTLRPIMARLRPVPIDAGQEAEPES